MKTRRREHAHDLLRHTQRGISPHWSVAAHPFRKHFTWQVLRDINKIAAFTSKIENLRYVDVP